MDAKSFTIEFTSLSDRIITDCGVCQAYIPTTNGVHPPVRTYKALWDTGATKSSISPKIASDLGLQYYKFTNVYHAKGHDLTKMYKVNLLLPNNVGFSCIPVLEGNLYGFDILIGMDIIMQGDFVITNRDGKTVCSFQIPSTHKYDFVKQNLNGVGQMRKKK